MGSKARGYYKSSSFKMATLFTVLLGMSAVMLGYYLYDFGSQNFTRETEALIDREIQHILSAVEGKNTEQTALYISSQSRNKNNPVIYLYYNDTGKILAGNIQKLPEATKRIKEGLLSFTVTLDSQERTVASKIYTFNDGSRLLVARDIHLITSSYETLKWITGFIIFFMLIVVLVSFFISIFVVGRINTIAHTAQQIMDTGDLSQRISIDSNWDDLSNLAQTLNALLDRVENLMQGIRDVSDSIAHDLRTPLTRLRNDLEDAQKNSLSQTDIERLLGDADQLLNTFSSLLRISNIEKGKRHHAFTQINLETILSDVTELYDTLAEDKQVALEVSATKVPNMAGDRDLLFQLFANLIDNAIKFSNPESKVYISLTHKSSDTIVTISDNGTGIAQSEKDKVFQRFYRTDASRNTPGSGLGLSLAKAVTDLHNAEIHLEDNNPGLSVVIIF